MEILRLEKERILPTDKTVVALGFFDGLHIGHRALLDKTTLEARARGLCPAVFTFADGPSFKGGGLRLFDEQERFSLLGSAKIERVYVADFPSLAPLSPEDFVRHVLIERLHAAAVVCGFNYRFGAKAAGDVTLLAELLATHGVPLFPIEEMSLREKTVSTTAIKAALSAGDVGLANAMLGRPYSLSGVVAHGKSLGRRIGIPTANIDFPDRAFAPRRGVYAVSCQLEEGGRAYPGVANVGVRPTVEKTERENCEVHLFEEVGELYGTRLIVRFHSYIRDEMGFPDLSALTSRIALDKQIAKEFFEKWNGQS